MASYSVGAKKSREPFSTVTGDSWIGGKTETGATLGENAGSRK
jgi:hypothetical protein